MKQWYIKKEKKLKIGQVALQKIVKILYFSLLFD